MFFPSLSCIERIGGWHSCSRSLSNAACSSGVGGLNRFGSFTLFKSFSGFAVLAKSTVNLRLTFHKPKKLLSWVWVLGQTAFLMYLRFFSFTLKSPGRTT